MRSNTSARQRIMNTLRAIDSAVLRECIGQVLTKYRIPLSEVDRLPISSFCVSGKYEWTREGGIVSGYADGPIPEILVPGIRRNARRAPLELVVLHVYCHELAHYLGVRTLGPGHSIQGFLIERHTKRWGCLSEFFYFNEGATEFLGREFFSQYVLSSKVPNISLIQICDYVAELRAETFGFYRAPVAFLRALVERFADTENTDAMETWQWLLALYAKGTDVWDDTRFRDLCWRSKFQCSFLPSLAFADLPWFTLALQTYFETEPGENEDPRLARQSLITTPV